MIAIVWLVVLGIAIAPLLFFALQKPGARTSASYTLLALSMLMLGAIVFVVWMASTGAFFANP